MLNIAGLKLPMIGDKIVTGNVYFVDSGATGASDSNDGLRPDRGHALATLDGGINKCTANNGDFIVLMPGHAETTTAIAWDVAGIGVIGIGHGADRPTLTASTAATDLINITAASAYMENVLLVGAASGNTALLDLSSAADDAHLVSIEFRQGATPLNAFTAGGADRVQLEGCKFTSTSDGPNYAILIESTSSNWIIKDTIFNYGVYGLDDAAICGTADPLPSLDGWIVDGCTFLGMDTTYVDVNSSSVANIGSLLSNSTCGYGADTADIDGGFDAGSWGQCNVLVTDNVDSRGRHVPVTTPA